MHAFNWHYESFAIPQGATRTLFGEHCLNKGFVFGKHLAFQGHFEVTEDIVRAWCDTNAAELAKAHGPAVQHRAEILMCLPERVAAVHVAARSAYAAWLAPIRGQLRLRTPRGNREVSMARRTQALTSSESFARPRRSDAAPKTDTSLPILQIAINLVFGTPFLACLFVAFRGKHRPGLPLSRRRRPADSALTSGRWPAPSGRSGSG